MAGDDPIMAVSRMFADLADEGGAAADSFATINSILKTSLNRTMLRFGRAMNDSVKSIQAFNAGLRTASKRVSVGVTQKQAARMGAASQASQAIHRTTVYVQDKQAAKSTNRSNIESAFDDLLDVIRNPLIVGIEKAGNGLLTLFNTLANISQALLTFKSLSVATKTQEISQSTKSAFDALITDEKHSTAIEAKTAQATADNIKKQTDIIGQYFGNIPVKTITFPKQAPVEDAAFATAKEQRINKVTNAYIQQTEILFSRLQEVNAQIADSADLLKIFGGTLGDNSKEAARLATLLQRQEALQKMAGSLNQRKDIDVAEAKETRLGDIGEWFKGLNFNAMKANILEFVAGLKLSTVLLTGAFATAIAYTAMKIYDIGKNAIPRIGNFFMKPLKEIYGFITGPLQSAFSRITSFVATLNPAYGEQANRALDDLSALIGRMLLPVFNAMLGTLKVFNSVLFKNMKNFQGLFNSIGNALAQFGGTAIGAFFNLMQSAVPVLNAFVTQLESALPQILTSMQQLFGTLETYMPTFVRMLEQIGGALDQYIKQKARDLGRELDLAAQAARNDAEAVAIGGKKWIQLSDVPAQFMYALKTTILTAERGSNALIGGFLGFIDEVENVINPWSDKSVWTAEGRAAKEAEMDEENKRRKEFAAQQQGIGVFDEANIAGGEFGAGAIDGLQEGFAAKGAAFQEIGQLGKNLAAASFGMNLDYKEEDIQLQRRVANAAEGILNNMQQFRGDVPVQGVR